MVLFDAPMGVLERRRSRACSGSRGFSEAFRQRLRELGYVEGRTVKIAFRTDQGDAERLPALAEELVRPKADAIAGNPVPGRTMLRATSTIPIVIAPHDSLFTHWHEGP